MSWFRRPRPRQQPSRTAADLAQLLAEADRAPVVITPPPAPRASPARTGAPLTIAPDARLGAVGLPAAEPPTRRAVGATLVLDEGQRVSVDGPGTIGRDPIAPESGTAIALDDSGRTLSRTHLEFGFNDTGMLWILDRDSGNGVDLHHPGAGPVRLTPGQRTVVAQGDVVRFGDHSLRIEPTVALVPESPIG